MTIFVHSLETVNLSPVSDPIKQETNVHSSKRNGNIIIKHSWVLCVVCSKKKKNLIRTIIYKIWYQRTKKCMCILWNNERQHFINTTGWFFFTSTLIQFLIYPLEKNQYRFHAYSNLMKILHIILGLLYFKSPWTLFI